MPTIQSPIHLNDLLGELYHHHRGKEEASKLENDRRAALLALDEPRLTYTAVTTWGYHETLMSLEELGKLISSKHTSIAPGVADQIREKAHKAVEDRRLLLLQVSQGKIRRDDLRGKSETALRLLDENSGKARMELRKEQGTDYSQPLWEFVTNKVCVVFQVEVDDFDAKLLKYSGLAYLRAPNDPDEFSAEIARLDNEGFADELLASVWNKYPEEAREMGLPKPSEQEGDTEIRGSGNSEQDLIVMDGNKWIRYSGHSSTILDSVDHSSDFEGPITSIDMVPAEERQQIGLGDGNEDDKPDPGTVDMERMQVYTSAGWIDVSSSNLLKAIARLTAKKGAWVSNKNLFGSPTTTLRIDKLLKDADTAVRAHIKSNKPKGYRWSDNPLVS